MSGTIFNDVRNVIMTTSEGYFTTSGNTSEGLPNRTMAYGKKERGHIALSDASSLHVKPDPLGG